MQSHAEAAVLTICRALLQCVSLSLNLMFLGSRGLDSFYFRRVLMHHGKGGFNVKRMSVESHHSSLSAHLAESHAGCGLISCSLWLFSVFQFSETIPAGMCWGFDTKPPELRGVLRKNRGLRGDRERKRSGTNAGVQSAEMRKSLFSEEQESSCWEPAASCDGA